MSEAVSTGAASAPSSGSASQGSASVSSGQTSAGSSPVNSGGQGFATQARGQSQGASQVQGEATQTQERMLGAADLDAFVEHQVNGKLEKIKLRDALKSYGLDKTANQRMQEAAQLRRQAQMESERFKNMQLEDFAKMKQVDLDVLAEERLAKKYELQQMSPVERENYELKMKISERDGVEKKAKEPLLSEIQDMLGKLPEGAEQASVDRLRSYIAEQKQLIIQEENRMGTEFVEAWKQTGLPPQKMFMQMAAILMQNNAKQLAQGKIEGDPLQFADAASKVKNVLMGSVRQMFSTMDASAIQDFIGQDIVKKLNDFSVQRATGQAPQNNQGPAQAASKKPDRPLTRAEYYQWAGIAK